MKKVIKVRLRGYKRNDFIQIDYEDTTVNDILEHIAKMYTGLNYVCIKQVVVDDDDKEKKLIHRRLPPCQK